MIMSLSTQYAPARTRQSAFAGGIASLADDQLYALQNPFALDGRVSSYPASARGFSVANSYLLTQPDAAMLIDTGFGKDEPVIRGQIEALIAPGLRSTMSRALPAISTSRPATPPISTPRCGSISAPRPKAATS
jgi:hypothetical protein